MSSNAATSSNTTMSPVTYMLHEGDCLEWLRSLPSDSVDSLVTDPPAGITFMGRKWDDDKGGRKQWIAWLSDILRECKRVMKPGAAGFVWALPRTSHWTGTACEDAGFEVRDVVTHLTGQGFPKSKSLLKPSSEHWILIRKPGPLADLRIDDCRVAGLADKPFGKQRANRHFDSSKDNLELVEPPDPHPSGRWPANAVFSHTTSCVKVGEKEVKGSHSRGSAGSPSNTRAKPQQAVLGKFNKQSVVEYVNPDGKETVADWRCAEGCPVRELDAQTSHLHGAGAERSAIRECGKTGLFGMSGDGQRFGDSGGASRFFHQFSHDHTDPQADRQPLDLPTFIHQAKASRSERERGCDGLESKERCDSSGNNRTRVCRECGLTDNGNNDHSECGSDSIENRVAKSRRNTHVSVKPLALMRHLCRLVTPVGGTVLDPFAGSGTTGCAAMLEGLSFLGAEREAEYVAIARARIGYYFTQSGRTASEYVAAHQKSNVSQQKKSNVAPQQNATKLRTLRNLPKRVT